MRLLGFVQLDPRNVQMTVLERWTERCWFRDVVREREKTYSMSIGVGRWLDGDHYILRQDARHFRLWELWQARRIEQKLDAFVFEPEPAVHLLPPVPVLPRR